MKSPNTACIPPPSLPPTKHPRKIDENLSALRKLLLVDHASGDNRGHRGAPKGAAIEGSIARLAGGVRSAKSPGMIRRKDREIGRLSFRDLSLQAQDARRASRKELYQAHQRHLARMNEFVQTQGKRRLESRDAKRRAIEFDILARRMMRRMIRGDRINAAVGQALDQRVPVFAGSKGRIHFVVRIV